MYLLSYKTILFVHYHSDVCCFQYMYIEIENEKIDVFCVNCGEICDQLPGKDERLWCSG